jgi:hypothetical protein
VIRAGQRAQEDFDIEIARKNFARLLNEGRNDAKAHAKSIPAGGLLMLQ